MVERQRKESDWLRRYTSEQPLDRQERDDSTWADDNHKYNGLSGQLDSDSHNGTEINDAETIFDFQLPFVAGQEIETLHRRAEYLLDEMEMGAADGAAFERDMHVKTDGRRENGIVEDSCQLSQTESQVLPEAALPSIRRRPKPTEYTRQQRESPLPLESAHSSQPSQPDLPEPLDSPVLTPATNSGSSSKLSSRHRTTAPIRAKIDSLSSSLSARQTQKLEEEIVQLNDQVNRLQQGRRDLTGHAFSLLREASAILSTQPERAGRAEYNVRQVRTLLERSSESRRRSARFGILLLLYLSFWLVLCIGGLIALFLYGATVRTMLVEMTGQRSGLSIHALPLILTSLAGGMGGVVGAIVSLVGQQRQGQEFDGQYVARYIIQPIMGVVLALFIYLSCLFLYSVQGIRFTDSLLAQLLPAIIALPAGLWQEMVYAMIYRVTSVFRSSRRR